MGKQCVFVKAAVPTALFTTSGFSHKQLNNLNLRLLNKTLGLVK